MVYQIENQNDIKVFNIVLIKLWLYANSKVAKKMEEELSIIHDHEKLNKRTEKLQEVIMLMRKDIQLWPCQELNSKDLNHIYTHVAAESTKNRSHLSSFRYANCSMYCYRARRKSKFSRKD
jgi:hypothetical protein